MEETKNIIQTKDKIKEVVDLFHTSLFLIQQKIAELEKELKEEEDKEKIEKIKNRINNIKDL